MYITNTSNSVHFTHYSYASLKMITESMGSGGITCAPSAKLSPLAVHAQRVTPNQQLYREHHKVNLLNRDKVNHHW